MVLKLLEYVQTGQALKLIKNYAAVIEPQMSLHLKSLFCLAKNPLYRSQGNQDDPKIAQIKHFHQ